MASRLKEKYTQEVVPALIKKFEYKNIMQIPKLEKVVINVTNSEARDNQKVIDAIINDLSKITGQRPMICRAKKSVANFKLRVGMKIGAKVTLRRDKMYEFVDRLINIALPHVRDFHGVSRTAFDKQGNYNLGLKEQTVFPEITFEDAAALHGLEVTFIIKNGSKEGSTKLLELFGMPFEKEVK